MKIHEKIQRLAEEKRWGQIDLLEFVPGAARSTMSNWWNGRSKPDLVSALLLARGLGVPLSWLADDEQGFPPPAQEQIQPPPLPPHEHDRDAFVIWEMAQLLGVERAKRRLMGLPNDAADGRAPGV